MEDEGATPSSSPPRGGVGLRAASALVRCVRVTAEAVAGSALALTQVGRRRTLPPLEDTLLLLPAHVLAQKIRLGEVSSESAVRAYIHRAGQVNPCINATVEGRHKEALEEARAVDTAVKLGTAPSPEEAPLLGVPFTAKEAVLIRGLSSTCGLVCRRGMKAEADSEAVAALRSRGGIPLAVTNTSEICMWWETYNKLHGQTNNPYDTTRMVGGSSGGEAALIASGGSLVGLGTDLGGSIRLPSFFTGIFGHKPSQGVVPHGGQYPPALEEISPYVVTGPMARYAADLRFVLKALVGREEARKLRLDEKVDLKSVKVHYMLDDGGHPANTPVSKEIQEAIKKVINFLVDRGLTVKEAKVRNLKHGFMIWCSHLAKVKDQRIAGLMAGDIKTTPTDPLHYEMWRWFSGRSDHTFPIILNACVQDHVAPLFQKTVEYFLKRSIDLKQEMSEILNGDSVFLYPTFPTTASHHGQMLVTPQNVGYSVAFNSLRLPVTQCPLGLSVSGLPMGVQIVTGDRNDRLSIAIAEMIEAELGGWVVPS